MVKMSSSFIFLSRLSMFHKILHFFYIPTLFMDILKLFLNMVHIRVVLNNVALP